MFERKKGVIIAGFAGIGKSSLKERVPTLRNLNIYDLKSNAFRKESDWEKTYIDCAEALIEKYDFVFVSTHDLAIAEMIRRRIKFVLIYPYPACKNEYKSRFFGRGSSEDYISRFMNNWDKYISKLENLNYPNKIRLRPNQYLSDVITRIRV